jgi:hypothetical protein
MAPLTFQPSRSSCIQVLGFQISAHLGLATETYPRPQPQISRRIGLRLLLPPLPHFCAHQSLVSCKFRHVRAHCFSFFSSSFLCFCKVLAWSVDTRNHGLHYSRGAPKTIGSGVVCGHWLSAAGGRTFGRRGSNFQDLAGIDSWLFCTHSSLTFVPGVHTYTYTTVGSASASCARPKATPRPVRRCRSECSTKTTATHCPSFRLFRFLFVATLSLCAKPPPRFL